MSNLAYFADDGNYGVAGDNIAIVDVSKWTEKNWQIIEQASDWARPMIARHFEEKCKEKHCMIHCEGC